MATEQQPLNLRPLKTAAQIAAEAANKTQVPSGAPLRTAAQIAQAAPSGGPIGRVPTSMVGGPIGQVPVLRMEQMVNPNLTGYTPGQFSRGSSALALPAPAAPDLNAVRPSVVAPTGAAPMASAGGVGSRLMGAAGMVGKAVPFIGDAIQAAAYGMDPNSNASTMGRIGRGVAAGLGSFGGRVGGGIAGTAVAPGVGTAVGSVGGSIAGAAGGAALYDSVFGEPEVAPRDEAAEFQKRMDMRTGDSPEARAARAQETPAQRIERGEVARRETKANYPSLFAEKEAAPAKPAAPKGEFKGPSDDEMARFRKQTGTPYDPKSITDKLNLERMRAGEQTFTSKQSREFRKANPTYRPGQYVKRG